jgi:hypothetical protein
MKRILLCVVFLLLPAAATAASGPPRGWSISGSRPTDYEYGTDAVPGMAGKQAAYIKAKPGALPNGFGTLAQTILADDYRGKRVRLSARMKTEDASGMHMWLRIDNARSPYVLSNMDERPVTGTSDWKRYETVLDVPEDSTALNFGFYIQGGKGVGWIDSVNLEIVGKDVPVSYAFFGPTRQPTNLGFER